jgi:hypothetical protein
MSTKSDSIEYWRNKAYKIALGKDSLSKSDLLAIADNVNVLNLKMGHMTGFLLSNSDAVGKKQIYLKFSKDIWGITPDTWQRRERYWLRKIRQENSLKICSVETDYPGSALSAEILARVTTSALFVKKIITEKLSFSPQEKDDLIVEAIIVINSFLSEICTKGRCSTHKLGDWTTNFYLEGNGVIIDSGRTKGLPYPEIILPKLFSFFCIKKILPEAYR